MKKNTRIRRKKPIVEEIEPRILYSADFSPAILDSNAVLPQAEQRILDAGGEFAGGAVQTQTSAPQSVRHEVVFVDTAAPDYQKLVQDITANSDAQHQYDVVLLKPGADGLKQITQTLAGMHDVSAVHIVSHGADGEVQLGAATLNFDSLLKNASQIKGWGEALAPGADILIYGCDVAEHADGKALVNALGRLTGADVAASTDLTGASALGGDWALEYHTGAIQASIVVSAQEQATYTGILQGVAVGGETLVNTTTAGTQQTGPSLNGKSVAVAPDGSYVVVWSGQGPGGSGDTGGNAPGVFFQRFSAAGAKLGGEIQVNQTTANAQQNASIAMDANGNFVIAWAGNGAQAGNVDAQGVFFRRYNAAGVAQGGETLVNTTTAGNQQNASIAMDASGNFIVAWDGNGTQVGNVDTQGVFFQRYNTAGVKQGTETLVNTTTALNQQNASIAMDASGNFIVAWDGNGTQVGNVDTQGVFFQRYNTAGAKQGTETLVNTTTALNQQNASIAIDANGNFIVAWDGNGTQVGNVDTQGAFFQRYNTAGAKQGTETLVNQTTANNQLDPSIAMDTNGNFVVSWTSTSQPGDVAATTAVVKRDFNADGTANGGETLVNTTTAGTQSVSSVAMNAYDQYVVIWQGNGVGDAAGVFSKRYAAALIVDTANDTYDAPFAQNTITISQLLNSKGPDTFISLREAIDAANNTANTGAPDRIYFRIPGAGTKTISVTAPGLPNITDAVVIDGYSQPGASANTLTIGDNAVLLIELSQTGAGGASGLVLAAGSDGSTIRGLVINRFTSSAIRIVASSNNTVVGNFLGTNAAGTAALGNQVGVYITSTGPNSTNNTVGGTTAADRNVISGNTVDGVQIFGSGTSGNVVLGNYIGLDVTGTVDLGNTNQGVAVFNQATNNTIGGTAAGAGNVISGNNGRGVAITTAGATGNVVQGNLIGTNAAGTAGVGNSKEGVYIDTSAANNTIGGTAVGAGNTIAYNTLDGVALGSTAGTGNSILSNSIYSNGGLGIDLAADGVTANDVSDGDAGTNNLQNFPTITTVTTGGGNTTVTGTFNSVANTNFRLEFFASSSVDPSGHGQGQVYLGFLNVTTNAAGNLAAPFSYVKAGYTLPAGWAISATATRANAGYTTFTDTSEFSGAVALPIAVDDAYSVNEDSTLVVGAPTTNLANWWKFDDGGASQTVVDSGSLGNNGTRGSTGGVDANDPTWTAGYVGTNALSFDGSSDYVTTASTLAKTASSFTLSAWFQTNTTSGQQILLWEGYSGGNAYGDPSNTPASSEMSLSVGTYNQDDNITFHLGYDVPGGGADPIYIVSNSAFTDTTAWHNATVTVSDLGGGVFGASLYVDGVLQGSDTGVQNDRSAWGALQIGAPGAATRHFDGQVDDVRVYNAALSPAQVQNIVQAGVLQNDSDADSMPIKVNTSVVTGPANGTLNISPSGSFIYTPNANFNGIDTFTYKATDGSNDSNLATVTITVNPVNDAPAGANKTVTTLEDTAYTFVASDFGFSDPNDVPANSLLAVRITSLPGAGSLTDNGVAVALNQFVAVADITGGLLKFTPAPNANGAGYASFNFAVQDDGGTANGGVNTDSTPNTITVNVTAVNDAPVLATGSVLAYTENQAATAINTVITTGDVDNATLASATVSITGNFASGEDVLGFVNGAGMGNISGSWNAGTGVLTLTSAGQTATLANWQTALRAVSYSDSSDTPSTLARTVSYTVNDGATNSNTVTSTVNVTAVNDAPVLATGSVLAYTENQAATAINTVITTGDVDNATLASATVSITGNFASGEDVLGFVNGAGMGNISGSWNAGTGVLTLTSAGQTATLANWQTALRAVSYSDSSDTPSTLARTVSYTVNDGATNSNTVTSTVNVTAVNDAPVLATGSVLAYTENQAATAINTVITTGDVDNATLASATVSITGNFASGEDVLGFVNGAGMGNISGSWNAGTGVLTLTSAGQTATLANWQTALRAVSYSDSSDTPSTLARTVSYTVNDGATNSNTVTSTVNVTAVNDAPVLATGSVLAYTENQAATAINTVITTGDVDNATLASATVSITGNFASGEDVLGFVNGAGMGNISGSWNAGTGVLTLTSAGQTATLANWQTALRAVSYSDSSDTPSTLARTVSYTVNDGATNSNTVTSTVNVTAVNDAPVLATGSVLAYTENQAATAINTVITTGDVDNATLASATVSITGNFASGEDVLGFVNGAGMGNISGSWNAGTGVLTLTSAGQTATLANWQTALRAVSYSDSSDTPSTLARTVSYTVNDGATNSNTVTSTVNVTAVNDAPANTVPGAQSTTMNTPINFSGANLISVADVDANGLIEQVTLSVTNGALSLSGTAGLTLVAGANGSASMTYQGTLTNLNAALNGLTYTPNLNYAGADTLSIATDDLGSTGIGGALTANSAVNLTVLANQPPTLSATANNPTFQEAAGLGTQAAAVNVFSGANAGTVEAGQNIIGLNFTVSGLLDGASERIVVDGTTVTLGANSSGTTATNGMGYTVNIAAGTATVSLTSVAGVSTANINALINGITYQDTNTDAPSAGARVFTLTQIQDSGGTVSGGMDTGALAIASMVNVVAVNDAPTAAAPAAYAATEQTVLNLANTGLTLGDVDALGGSETLTLSVVSGVLNASAGATGVGVAGTGTATLTLTGSTAQLTNLLNGVGGSTLSYINNSDTPPATDTLTLSINDNGNSGSGGAQTANASSTINITAVNDAPTAAAPAAYAATEQTVLNLANTGLTLGDVDALGGSETLTLSVVSGVLNASAGATGVGVAGTGTATLTLTGSTAQLTNLLNGVGGSTLSYINNSDTPPATDTLTLSINDNGNSGSGGAQTANASSTINITAVNDAPTAAAPAAYAATEQTVLNLANTGLTLGDVDALGGSETLTLSVVSGVLNASAGATGVGVAGTGTATLTLTGSTAQLTNLLNGVGGSTLSYINNSDTPPATDTLTLSINDNGNSGSGGAQTANASSTINITAVNDAPTAANGTVSTVEDTPYVFNIGDFNFSDVDAGDTLQSVTVVSLSGGGSLTLSGIAVSAGQVISAANISANSLVFTPAAGTNGAGYASFGFSVSDGTASSAPTNVLTVDVGSTNDAPQGVSKTVTTLEDNAYTFAAVDFGFSDPNDSPANNLQAVEISTLPTAGTLTDNGVAVSAGQFVSVADITGGKLVFAPAANASGNSYASFTFQVQDDGGTAGGGVDTDPTPRTMTVNVTPVNDAPQGTSNTVTTLEDTAYTFSVADFGFADPNDAPADAVAAVRIATLPAGGALINNGFAVAAGQFVSVADIAGGRLTFTPAANANGAAYASFSFQVQDSGGIANGGVDVDPAPRTMTINVTAVNDAPVLGNDTLTIVRGGSVILSNANLSATDVDNVAAGLAFTVSNVLDGQFELVTTPGVAVTNFTQGAIAGGQVRFVHDGSTNPPAFDFMVSDGTLSAGPTAATIVFSLPATGGGGGPIIAPPPPPPPAPGSNGGGGTPPAPTPPAPQTKLAQPSVSHVVPVSGGLPMVPEAVGIEMSDLQGTSQFLRVEAKLPRSNLNPAPLLKPAGQTLLIAGTDPQYSEFGPLTKVDWSAQTAFPSADRNPSEHDQIQVIMESVRMGGIALSVGVVWWASRVTGLIGSLLASMPAWRQLDPLPIVGRDEEEDRWDETGDSEADADELAISMVLEGPRSRDAVSA